MKEKIEEISLSMERGHRRILRVLSALAVIGLFAALWKWRGLAAMEPIVEGGAQVAARHWGEHRRVARGAVVLYLLPWPLLALFGRMTPFCSIFARRPCVGSNAELSRAAVLAVRLLPPVLVGAALWFALGARAARVVLARGDGQAPAAPSRRLAWCMTPCACFRSPAGQRSAT